MIDYHLYHNQLTVYFADQNPVQLFLNEYSGQIYYRYKIDTFFKYIPHPAIYIGQDFWGKHYFIHNHYEAGTAVLVEEQEFSKGNQYYPDARTCSNDPLSVVQSAINQAMLQEPYHFKKYNCQTFTNIACTNTRKSETVEIVGKIALVALAIVAGRALLNGR